MIISLVLILLCGWAGGQLASKIGAPPLVGMILVGIIISPEIGGLIAPLVLDMGDELRSLAVMVILLRAGLGLDREKLVKQGSVAIRLGILPALTEAIAVALAGMWLFKFDLLTGLLLGCVVAAESPAVIVPGMLRLKSLGWGVAKGIPDVILTGSALSDVLVLLLFSLLLNFSVGDTVSSSEIWLLPLQVILQIILGIIIGFLAAKLIIFIVVKKKWTQNLIHNTLITACLALLIIAMSKSIPYFSGYLATMAMGFFIIEFDPPTARQLRIEFNHLWVAAEILLFVLMGASIELQVLKDVLLKGILLLVIGLLIGRIIGWYLATIGSDWNWKEKLFLLPGNSAKATVQAAIGAIPLAQGVAGGEIILAIAALSILTTAPLGAWAIPTFAPKLLVKDAVDPTKVIVTAETVFLVILDRARLVEILTATADFARRSNGKVIVAIDTQDKEMKKEIASLLLDIRYQITDVILTSSEDVIALAENNLASSIILSRYSKYISNQTLAESIINKRSIPLIIV